MILRRTFPALCAMMLAGGICAVPLYAQEGAATNQSQRPEIKALELPRQTSGEDRIISQRANSFDAGDFYVSPKGKRILHRLAGSVAIALDDRAGKDRVINRLTAGSGPLDGYTVDFEASEDVLVLKAPESERKRQRQEPTAFQGVVNSTRRVTGVRAADPVFIDPESALYLISTGEIIVALKPEVDPAAYFGAEWPNVRRLRGAKYQFILPLRQKTAEALLADVNARATDPRVEWAEPNFMMQVIKHFTPNDPLYPNQWHLNNTGQGGGTTNADVNAPEAWNTTQGTNQIVIAILDAGVQLDHPDLAANIFTNLNEIPGNGVDDDGNGYADDVHGWDFYFNNNDPSPKKAEDNHGTATAGVAVASGNNGLGVVGIAHNCKILPVKVSDGGTFVDSARKAEAIRYAGGLTGNGTWRGADVISMSFQSAFATVIDSALSDAATLGRAGKGCAIFASSGNDASGYREFAITSIRPGDWVFEWRYKKNGSISLGEDTAWLANVTFPNGVVERFDTLGWPSGWSTSGDANWSVVDNPARAFGTGRYEAKAGTITHNQETRLRTPTIHVNSTGELVYWIWKSTEATNDTIALYASTNGGGTFDGPYIRHAGTNFFSTHVNYPASHANVISVGASSDFDYRSNYSQYGSNLDFVVPSDGGRSGIYTTDRTGTSGYNTNSSPSGDYEPSFGGTSAACPLAAGIGALVLSVNPGLTADEVRTMMRNSTDKIGRVTYTNGFNQFYGYGRLNAQAAVSNALTTLPLAIFGQPVNRSNSFGTTATFTVIASGAPPLSYQWQKNGTNLSNGGNISGATTSSLYISNVVSSDVGNYRIIVTNVSGSVTSSVATLTVLPFNLSDCTESSLRAALQGFGLVSFAVDCTNISLASPITITNDVVIDGTGHSVTLSGGNSVRLLTVNNGASLTLRHLTLANGMTSTNGGGLYIEPGAVVVASDCLFSSNRAAGAAGTAGAVGADTSGIGGNGGNGGNGGQGRGGALYNLGRLSLSNCQFLANTGGGGAGAAGGAGGNGDFQGGNGGRGGSGADSFGGAIYSAGILVASNCTFSGNSVTAGAGALGGAGGSGSFPGLDGNGGAGGAAWGAGLYSLSNATIVNCTFNDNTAHGGNSAAGGQQSNGNGTTGPRGGDSFGGGVANLARGAVTNCTFHNNSVTGGNAGSGGNGDLLGGNGGDGGNGTGGGLFNSGTLDAVNSTFASSGAVGGTNGLAGNGSFPGSNGSMGSARGGNIAGSGGTFILKSSIVATNLSGGNGYGTITDAGNNISSDSSLAFGSSSLKNTDPKLGSLATNGGPTKTMLLLAGSPAVNAGGDACLAVDQRGFPRPSGAHCDIGAVEMGAPAIQTQPESRNVAVGLGAEFAVTATSEATLTYQWRFNGTNFAGATSPSFTVAGDQTQIVGTNQVQVVVTNYLGAVTSQVAVLRVGDAPSIRTGPSNQTVLVGTDVTFTVAANGTEPLAYQWRMNGANIGGATTSSHAIANAQTNHTGNYDVVVTNDFGSVTSQVAVLRVGYAPSIRTGPQNQTALVGANVTFTVTADGDAPLAYQWRMNGTNIGGATASSHVIANAQTNHTGSYDVVVANDFGSVTSQVAVLRVGYAPSIQIEPQNQTVLVGTNVTFTVTASGTEPLAYQWRMNGTDIGGATASSHAIANAQTNLTGNYDVVVTNDFGAVTSRVATLRVLVPVSLTTLSFDQTNFWFTFKSETGLIYIVEFKDTLNDTGWTRLSTNEGTGGLLTLGGGGGTTSRFFRVVIE